VLARSVLAKIDEDLCQPRVKKRRSILKEGMPAVIPVVRKTLQRFVFVGLALSVFAAAAEDARAQQSVADFYRGKQLFFVIRSEPGGGFDLYSRLLGTYMVRHLPGHPTLVAQNMPGAGGLQAVNHLANFAPRDGTYLTMTSQALAMDQALGYTPQFKADLRSFGWVGNVSDSNVLTYTWHTSPVKTIDDAKKYEATMGGTGATSATSWLPELYNKLLGTKFKVVNGYSDGTGVKLAMERGEIDGYGANPWSALLSATPELVRDNLISILVQVGVHKEPDLPNVPLLADLATNDRDKAILEFVSKSFAVGRPIGTTPGVPPERLAALRKAFDETLVDPDFVAAAKKAHAEIKPMNGATLQALIDDILGAPQDIKDLVKAGLPPR
jgi:tripartite-type tricarboxylate transporter receptor subunit TctC